MKKQYITDRIKRGIITYQVGDEVVVVRRKKNGYPRGLKDDVIYIIKDIEGDNLIVSEPINDRWHQPVKVHRSYVGNKSALRDIKIDEILKQS